MRNLNYVSFRQFGYSPTVDYFSVRQFPLRRCILQFYKSGIQTIFLHQFLMCSTFSDHTISKNNNLICPFNSPHSMCNHKNCFSGGQFFKCQLDLMFILRIRTCCSFIQHNDRCIFLNCPCKCNPLIFTT